MTSLHRAKFKTTPDYTGTPEGAKMLIERIKATLQRQGRPLPEFEIVPVAGRATLTSELTRPRYDVRSNMVDGLVRGPSR